MKAVTRPSTNPARRKATSLIEHSALPLRHATNHNRIFCKYDYTKTNIIYPFI